MTAYTNSKPSSYRWVILIVNFLFLTFAYAGLSTWAIAVPDLSKTFNLTSTQVMWGASMLMAGYAVGSFVESFIAAKIGFKKTGLFAAVLLIIPQFVIPYTQSFNLILLLRFIQGWGVVWFVTTSMTAAWFPLEERGMATGIVSGGIPFGMGIGGIIGGWLLSLVGSWQTSFIIFGIVVLVVAIIWAIFAKDPEFVLEEERKEEAANAALQNVSPFKLAAGWLVAFCLFANAFQLIGFNTVLPNFMFDLNYSSTEAGTVLLFAGLIGAISTPLGGIFSDSLIKGGMEPTKARAYVMAFAGFLIAGISTIIFPYVAQLGYTPLLLMAIVVGWGVPLTNASIGSLPTDMLKSPEIAGKLFGLTILVGISGAVIAPFLITSLAASSGWTVAFAVLGAVALAGTFLGIIIPSFRIKNA